ncbi:hypothetical protein ACFLRC_02270 [Candidatus Altiarchaeota archaeon]
MNIKASTRTFAALLTLVVVLAFYAAASGTIETTNGDLILSPSSGKVGIGTDNPSRNLDVRDTGTPGITYIKIRGGEGKGAYLELFADEGDDTTDRWRIASHQNNKLHFQNNAKHRLTITALGSVGIRDGTPSQELDVNGDVRANSYIEYSPFYDVDDALSQIMAITCLEDTQDVEGWCDVDHDTLPNGVKVLTPELRLRDIETGELFNPDEVSEDELINYEEVDVEVQGRSLTHLVEVITKAVQELGQENQQLKVELCNKDPTYSFCVEKTADLLVSTAKEGFA